MHEKNYWEELIDRHLHGELDEAEKERFAELLDSNAAARQELVEHAQWPRESHQSSRDAGVLAGQR